MQTQHITHAELAAIGIFLTPGAARRHYAICTACCMGGAAIGIVLGWIIVRLIGVI